MRQFISFIFFEVIIKTLFICLVATFLVSILLGIASVEEGIKIPIRGDIGDVGDFIQQDEVEYQQRSGVHHKDFRVQTREQEIAENMSEDTGQSSNLVYLVQERLKKLGYNPGPIDGLLGEKTKTALKKFQRDNKLGETGKLDKRTKKRLDLQKSTIETKIEKAISEGMDKKDRKDKVDQEITEIAIENIQRDNNLPVTRELDEDTKKELGLQKSTIETEIEKAIPDGTDKMENKKDKRDDKMVPPRKGATTIIHKEAKYSSFFILYIDWIKKVIHGELGRGKAGQRVAEEVMEKFKVTFILSFASLIPALGVSFLIGLVRTDKVWINAGGGIIHLFTALPAFFLGYLLIGIFDFSITGIGNYLMAIITLGLSSGIINEMSRVINNAMSNELSRDYIETARAKGLRERTFPYKGTIGFHAFRNALISIVPRIGSLFAFIISGSMVVEQVFSLYGLSFMLLDGLTGRDIARVLTVILLSVLIVRIGTILSNLVYLGLNPRYGWR